MYEELVKKLREQADYYCCHMGINSPPAMTFVEAADAIEDLQKQLDNAEIDNIKLKEEFAKYRGENRWIPVTERLPEEEESVFVVRDFLGVKGQVPPSRYTEVAYRIGDSWVADSDEFKIARHRHTDPIYWMPLPEPPKDGAE